VITSIQTAGDDEFILKKHLKEEGTFYIKDEVDRVKFLFSMKEKLARSDDSMRKGISHSDETNNDQWRSTNWRTLVTTNSDEEWNFQIRSESKFE
jgi:hypothetical protein